MERMWITLGVSVITAALRDKKQAKALRRILLKLRDAITAAYPEE